jgi:cysteine desulfurase family protein
MVVKIPFVRSRMGIYLDNAATSFPKPKEVYEAVNKAMTEIGANPGRGGHKLSLLASRIVFDCREELANFFNIPDSKNIIFTSNATEALNLAIKGILKEGDKVITTPLEHNSVLRPLSKLQKELNIKVTYIKCNDKGLFTPEDVFPLLDENIKLIVITHASNVIGNISPIEEIFSYCRKKKILTLLDAAQTAGLIPIDVEKMSIDLMACPGHKSLLGPHGTGFLYIRNGIELDTLKEGGTGTESSSIIQPLELPERFEAGTLNMPGIAGLLAGIKFIKNVGLENIRNHELKLMRKLVEGLNNIKNVKLYGALTPEKMTSTLSFNLINLDCSEVGFILDEVYNIYTRVGLHCAPLAHKTIGTYPSGTVRVSPGYFNTEGDIDEFLRAIEEINKRH